LEIEATRGRSFQDAVSCRTEKFLKPQRKGGLGEQLRYTLTAYQRLPLFVFTVTVEKVDRFKYVFHCFIEI